MQSNLGRAALGAAVVVVAVVLLIVLKDDGGGDDRSNGGVAATAERTGPESNGEKRGNPSKPAIPTIVIRDGKPVGGVKELTYEAGERIRFEVDSDVSDEVHVHGYDISKEVRAGRPVDFDFPATIEGVFEAELHGTEEQILELRVNP